jgi:large subunit ribosomal protein L21
MTYAIIQVGGKQYRVRAGEKLLVDRLAHGEGNTFSPRVLLVGGDGPADLAPKDGVVTARVVTDLRGPKIRIGKYKKRTGYKRHNGFRAALTQIEIQSIGAKKAQAAAKPAAEEKPKAAAKPKAAPKPKAETVAKPKAEPKAKAPAKPKAAAKPKAPAKPKAAAKKAPAAKAKPRAPKKEES